MMLNLHRQIHCLPLFTFYMCQLCQLLLVLAKPNSEFANAKL